MAETETVETTTTEAAIAAAETTTATEAKQAEVKTEAQVKQPSRPFDPEMFDKLLEYYPTEIKERLGVTALEVALARGNAVTEYGLSAEEAAALPGKTAADITAAAKVTSGIIAKRLESAKVKFAEDAGKTEPPQFYRLPSEAEAAKETDPVQRAHNEYARIMGQ